MKPSEATSPDIVSETAALRRKLAANKQESLSILAAGIAHDVNNVLAVVLNTVESQWMDADDDQTLLAVNTIRDAVRRGTSMMRELMTFAGETRGKLQRIEDPNSIIRECHNLVRGIAAPNIVISYALTPGLPAVDANPDQCWKVIFNLVKNAAEAMKDHPGEIRISSQAFEMTPMEADSFTTPYTPRSGRGVLLTVSDNGPGIPQDFIRRIFDPYTSTKSLNRGLGLAIVNSIIEANGGGIRVRSSEGFGTAFDIFVPVSRQSAATATPIANPTPTVDGTTPASSTPPRMILIVDDDVNIVKTTSILLKTMHYIPLAAANRHEAMLQFRSHAQSLGCVLMDAHLGETDTLRLLRAFRMVSPSVPVVVHSGSSKENIAEMFSTQSYDDFLAKPFTFAELKDCVERVTRIRTA